MKRLLSITALAAALIVPLVASEADAASFNCRTARLDAEKAVCTGPILSRLDEDLAYWYGKAKERARYFDQTAWLRSSQRDWLVERNACGWNRACLRWVYRDRIAWLRSYAEHV
jgi:uncharacterized protein